MIRPLKIVVSGPVGAGKTTYIRTLSETEVITTEEQASEDIGKANTTVAMDFGSFRIDEHLIFLFGTPGQERFDFMWEVLCEGALGLLLLIDGSRVRDFPQARKIFDFVSSQVPIPCVIGVTHLDAEFCWEAAEVADYMQVPPEHVVGIDARNSDSALDALYLLFEVITSRNLADAIGEEQGQEQAVLDGQTYS